MQTVYIALGSNLGDRRRAIDAGLRLLAEHPAVELRRVSSVIETDPIGPAGQGPYLNAAAEIGTRLEPETLLAVLLETERALGRDRAGGIRWGPRTLDLDLLLYGERVIDLPGLTVPHPRLGERVFVLEPLAELARQTPVPGDGRTVGAMLRDLRTITVEENG